MINIDMVSKSKRGDRPLLIHRIIRKKESKMEGFEKFVSGRRAPEAAGFTNIPCLAFYESEKRWEVIYYYANPLDKRKENKKAHWTTYTKDKAQTPTKYMILPDEPPAAKRTKK